MQKVERKKHRPGRPRRLIWLLAACAALGVGLYAALGPGREEIEIPTRSDFSGDILNEETESIVSVTVAMKGQEEWTADQGESGLLYLRGEDSWAVDEGIGERLLDALAHLKYEDILTEDPADWRDDAAEFGLADPMVRVSWTMSDGREFAAAVGDSIEPEENSVYYMTLDGDDRLYALPAGTVQDVAVEKALLHPVVQPEIREVLLDRITVKKEDRVTAEWKLTGNVTDQDAGSSWVITVPFEYPADEESIDGLKTSAGNIRLGAYIGEANEETLERYGLKEPRITLELHMAAGSTGTVSDSGVYDVQDREEELLRLYIGNEKNEMTSYAMYGDSIYTVSTFSLSAITDILPENTACRYTVLTPLDSLEKLEITEGDSITVYTINREGEENLCYKDGEEISYEAFEAAYSRLEVVTVSGSLPDGAEWGETNKKYAFSTVSGRKHETELSDWDGMHDAVTVDGHTRYYLIKGGMTELP